MIQRHSPVAHAAYHDLLSSLASERAAEIRGTPFREVRGNRAYWYDLWRIGSSVRKRYIGEDTPQLAADIARHRDLQAEAKARAAHRARLVRILRAEGFLPTDAGTGSLYAAMAKAGVFRLGGTIVGTHAFRLYEGELGLRLAFDQTAQTGDLDIAQFERLSLALEDRVDTPLADTFRQFDFEPVPSVQGHAVWRWKQTRSDTLVEFLTPSFRPDEDIRDLPALGVSAQSLHFLNYLIAEPIRAAVLYRSGVLVQVPRPERFAIHKLIVADRRQGGPNALKSVKDRAQAAFLIAALAEDRPDDLALALEDARARGPNWGRRIDASLARMPDTAALLHTLS
ncbi:nucleotidyltransferase family protein [Falsirhodobacter deserti]|uniref:nucleotidyltransferase family protein n=1 Tax=Falsirhodobacter deserti TaxID=1365611 RepID=UPI000FE2AFAA|nr:GSU2403 family nucleotidyltransferase fold protein [Falsirhodobacter deserti]